MSIQKMTFSSFAAPPCCALRALKSSYFDQLSVTGFFVPFDTTLRHDCHGLDRGAEATDFCATGYSITPVTP